MKSTIFIVTIYLIFLKLLKQYRGVVHCPQSLLQFSIVDQFAILHSHLMLACINSICFMYWRSGLRDFSYRSSYLLWRILAGYHVISKIFVRRSFQTLFFYISRLFSSFSCKEKFSSNENTFPFLLSTFYFHTNPRVNYTK